jgi:hypothetical protein
MSVTPNFRSLEKTDGYVLKEANVIIERRRMIMKVLVSALFAVAEIIPPALADEREDAYAGVERWSEAFNSGDVEQIVRMYTDDALVLGTLSPGMISTSRHRGYGASSAGGRHDNAGRSSPSRGSLGPASGSQRDLTSTPQRPLCATQTSRLSSSSLGRSCFALMVPN